MFYWLPATFNELARLERVYLDNDEDIGADGKSQFWSCVIMDECHERSIDADILLAPIKETLYQRPNLRFIIMSATVHTIYTSILVGDCMVPIPQPIQASERLRLKRMLSSLRTWLI
ncbi:hypothetical protein NXS19_005037 [Fusarium pseudograminearum]|nr:hypothetical protein NXS19_005037 [Fusarium pseudograminearum]